MCGFQFQAISKKKLDSDTGGEYSLGDGLLNGPI